MIDADSIPVSGDVQVTWAVGVQYPDGRYRVLKLNHVTGRRLMAPVDLGYHPGGPAFWAEPKHFETVERVA